MKKVSLTSTYWNKSMKDICNVYCGEATQLIWGNSDIIGILKDKFSRCVK